MSLTLLLFAAAVLSLWWTLPRGMGWFGRLLAALAWAPLCVSGVVSLLYFFLQQFGCYGPRPLRLAMLIAVVVGLGLSLRSRVAVERVEIEIGDSPLGTHRSLTVLLGTLLLATVLLLVHDVMRVTPERPYGASDAISMWHGHARILARTEGDPRPIYRQLRLSHPDYPLHLKGTLAGLTIAAGQEDVRISQTLHLMFLLGLGAAMYQCTAERLGTPVAAATTSVLLASPVLWKWSTAQCADIPMAYLILCSVWGFDEALRGRRRVPAVLLGFALGLIVWTKVEGLLLSVSLLIAVGIVGLRRPTGLSRSRMTLGIATGSTPSILAAVLFGLYWVESGTLSQVIKGEVLAKLLDSSRWWAVGNALLGQLNPYRARPLWGVFWIVALVLVVSLVLRCRTRTLAGVASLLSAVILLSAYIVTPSPLEWQLATSLPRLLLQLYPLWLLASVLALWPSQAVRSPRTEASSVSPLVS